MHIWFKVKTSIQQQKKGGEKRKDISVAKTDPPGSYVIVMLGMSKPEEVT